MNLRMSLRGIENIEKEAFQEITVQDQLLPEPDLFSFIIGI